MAQIPVPRSFNAILGNMLDAFLSRTGLSKIRPGSPLLSIMMAGAQSGLRSSKDIFDFLNSGSLDRATGQALDRIGADEDCPRIGETAASGTITIGDSRYTKIATKIFPGKPAPIVGGSLIYVSDASLFTATGSLYIGRGTTNYEGPLAYDVITNFTTYYSIHLTSPTLKYHNLNEPVVFAQGGDRVIAANTVVQTPQGSLSSAITYSTLFSSTLPNGEVELLGVPVVAVKPGVIGNIPANAINGFSSNPFTGATAYNSLPYTNGLATENDDTYRERIKAVKQSRVKGTDLAVQTAAIGLTATDENKRITSASLVSRQGAPTTLYIDDGTGYEESALGVAIETLVDLAVGGEQYTQLASLRPVTKAFVITTIAAPFALVDASILAVKVGGLIYEHTFDATLFRNIANASAYEIVASINGDSTIEWSARTASGGTLVVIFAKGDTNEEIQVVTPAAGVDANDILLFPTNRVDTLHLYRSDRLLYKDGLVASLTSNPIASWDVPIAGDTLILDVDGTGLKTYTFANQDFVDAQTGFSTVAKNTVAAWAQVFNIKVPGITAAEVGGLLVLTSNIGASARAMLGITGGTLVASNMFDAATSNGAVSDYTLNRNRGQICLTVPLVAGERLTAGSVNTRGFLESSLITPITVAAGDGHMWFTFDSAAELISDGLNPSSVLTLTNAVAESWGKRMRYTCPDAVFLNVQSGDWAIMWDSAIAAGTRGTYRVSAVDTAGKWFEFDSSTDLSAAGVALAEHGMVFVRAAGVIKRIIVSVGANQTAYNFAADFNTPPGAPTGATAATYRTNYWRVATDTFGSNGDATLAACDIEGAKAGIAVGTFANNNSQLAFVESGAHGTPAFDVNPVVIGGGATNPWIYSFSASLPNIRSQDELVCLTPFYDLIGGRTWAQSARMGNNSFFRSTLEVGDTTTAVKRIPMLRYSVSKEFIPEDLVYFAAPYSIAADDELVVVADGDVTSKRFTVPMSRQVKPVGAYGATITISETDSAKLGVAFGAGFDFEDFAVLMPARTVTHSATAMKALLWRYYRLGSDGNMAAVRYTYPAAPSTTPSAVTTSILEDDRTLINVALPSGAAKTGLTFRPSTHIGVMSAISGSIYKVGYYFGFPLTAITRVIRIGFTPGAVVTPLAGGDVITGSITGFTATIVGAPGANYLVITAPTGSFQVGESITSPGKDTGTVTVTNYGYVTATPTLPGRLLPLTKHRIPVSGVYYLKSSSGNFTTGSYTVVAATNTTLSYVDAGTAEVTEGNIGTISHDSAEVTLVGAAPSPVAVGDMFRLKGTSLVPASWSEKTLRIAEVGPQYLVAYTETVAVVPANVLWYSLTDATAPIFMPFDTVNNTATKIAQAVNALAAVTNSNCPVTAKVLNAPGTGVIDMSHMDENLTANSYDNLVDGINFVKVTNHPANPLINDYTLDFKNAVDATLAASCDWVNEDVRLAPITPATVAAWMNTYAVTGLSSACEIKTSSQRTRVQIASLTPGTLGSVQVQGGSANSTSASVVGAAAETLYPAANPMAVSTINTSDSAGFVADAWVKIENMELTQKEPLAATAIVTGITAGGVLSINNGTGDKLVVVNLTSTQLIWKVEKHGAFVCYSITARDTPAGGPPGGHLLDTVYENDWIVISKGTALAGNTLMSDANCGIFRIVRKMTEDDYEAFWIVNADAVEEEGQANLVVTSSASVMAGDIVRINTPMFGAANMGDWTVASVSYAAPYTITLDVSTRTPVVYGPGAVAPMGTALHLLQFLDAEPVTQYKQVKSISLNNDSGLYTDLKFPGTYVSPWFNPWGNQYEWISEAAGSVITALDKLAFPVDLAQGVDGYSHTIGLVGEATRVIYGDQSDPAGYPGVAASGSNINVSGPLVRRITVALSLRVRTGISSSDVGDRVRSSVASVINATGVGKAIAISDIVAAARKVNGVVAVAVVSPSYTSVNDLITIQAYEKPMVLDLEQDITVSFVGV